jgi:uncharacterized protein RhaS with RHS repeats
VGTGDGLNLYAYAGNEPIARVDTSGLAYTELYNVKLFLTRLIIEAGASWACNKARKDVSTTSVWLNGAKSKCNSSSNTPVVASYTSLFFWGSLFLKLGIMGAEAFGVSYFRSPKKTDLMCQAIYGDAWWSLRAMPESKQRKAVVIYPLGIWMQTMGGISNPYKKFGNVLIHEYAHFGGCEDVQAGGTMTDAQEELGCNRFPAYPYNQGFWN